MDNLSPEVIHDFKKTVLDFFSTEGRSFPWRETADPYSILVSEIMLQQTQTDRVVPKYLNWLFAFPTLESLAEAPFNAVLERWIGLGYNRRARYLHEACKAILRDYNGVFPHDPEILELLPGIGPYTARAVSTFAFGTANVFIETNIRAVYLFFFFPGATNVPDRDILELVRETIDDVNPREWYYALMDYGATLKKKTDNPNRRSKHYIRQTQFAGSLRQARGAIIRQLGINGQSRLDAISSIESIPYERIEQAARALLDEGLVAESAGIYRIS